MNKSFEINGANVTSIFITSSNAFGGGYGRASVNITNGDTPFTILWSNGYTGVTATNLIAGTYTVFVTDGIGCTTSASVQISGDTVISSGGTFEICNSVFTNDGEIAKRSAEQMVVEGYFDLTSNDIGCILNGTLFYAEVFLNENVVITEEPFYIGSTLNDFPADNLWADTVKELIESFENVPTVKIQDGFYEVMQKTNEDTNSAIPVMRSPIAITNMIIIK